MGESSLKACTTVQGWACGLRLPRTAILCEMGRLALITGASSGIGATFAIQLAARGYDLVLVARREDRLQQVAGTLRQSGGVALEVLPADLATDEGLERVEQRIARAQNLELLVNNAGFGSLGYFHNVDVQSQ